MTALSLVQNIPPPPNGEGLSTPHAEAFKTFENDPRQSKRDHVELQAIADRMDRFKRMQRKFDKHGWNLHPLQNEATLAVHRTWATSEVCHSFRDATALLKRIGVPLNA
jgi:hypothetical protein